MDLNANITNADSTVLIRPNDKLVKHDITDDSHSVGSQTLLGRTDPGPTTSSSSGLDDVLETLVGDGLFNPGRFAVLQFFLYMISNFSMAFPILNFVFIGYNTPHTCAVLPNETSVLDLHGLGDDVTATFIYRECSIDIVSNASGTPATSASMSCINGHDYGGDKHISFISEWDLVCENETPLAPFVQTILMLGQAAGALLTTSVADNVGRKPVVITSFIALIAVGTGAAYAPNIYVLIVMRFFTGFFQQGVCVVASTLNMENFLPRHRRYVGVLCGTTWNSSMASFALCAWLMKDRPWRDLQLLTAATGLVVLLYATFVSESPRWLIANKKYDKALEVLKRACRYNNKDFATVKKMFQENIVNAQDMSIQNKADEPDKVYVSPKYNVLDILKNRTLRKNTAILSVIWMTCASTYFGLFLSASSLAGDRYLNFFLLGFVDYFGDFVILAFLDRLGRRLIMFTFLSLTGSSLLTSSLLLAYGTSDLERTLTTVFFILGKFGIGVCFNVMFFVFTNELYPTNIRSAGFGVCSSMARAGGMVAPYSRALIKVVLWGPGAVFTTMCLISGVLILQLPETRGRSLPTTIEDMQNWECEVRVKDDVQDSSTGLKRRLNDGSNT